KLSLSFYDSFQRIDTQCMAIRTVWLFKADGAIVNICNGKRITSFHRYLNGLSIFKWHDQFFKDSVERHQFLLLVFMRNIVCFCTLDQAIENPFMRFKG